MTNPPDFQILSKSLDAVLRLVRCAMVLGGPRPGRNVLYQYDALQVSYQLFFWSDLAIQAQRGCRFICPAKKCLWMAWRYYFD
jgi:hypothetical protein